MLTTAYLNQIRKYECMIDDKLVEIARLRSICTNITTKTDKENVKSSGSQDKLADAIAKIVDLERETDELVDNLVSARKRIISQIDAMENTVDYQVLTCRYVHGMKIHEIASKLGYAPQYVKEKKKKAELKFEKKYGSQYKYA